LRLASPASAYLNADDVYVVELADDRASLGDAKTVQGREEAQLPPIPVEVQLTPAQLRWVLEKYGRSTEGAEGVKVEEDLALNAEGGSKDEEVLEPQDALRLKDTASVSTVKSGTPRVSVQGGSDRSPAGFAGETRERQEPSGVIADQKGVMESQTGGGYRPTPVQTAATTRVSRRDTTEAGTATGSRAGASKRRQCVLFSNAFLAPPITPTLE